MTNPNENCPETVDISFPGTSQTIIDVLASQYGHLESGEARAKLEALQETVWNDEEFNKLFDVVSTVPPYVYVTRKQDGVSGTVMFVDQPRFYFSFNTGCADDDRKTA